MHLRTPLAYGNYKTSVTLHCFLNYCKTHNICRDVLLDGIPDVIVSHDLVFDAERFEGTSSRLPRVEG